MNLSPVRQVVSRQFDKIQVKSMQWKQTELCLFYINSKIVSDDSMNVLGVIFDSKLSWNNEVAETSQKAKKGLYTRRTTAKTLFQIRNLHPAFIKFLFDFTLQFWNNAHPNPVSRLETNYVICLSKCPKIVSTHNLSNAIIRLH